MALHIEPQDSERICARLDIRLRQYHSSAPSAARDTAIEDAETLRRALERRHEHAFSIGLYFLVRATTSEQLEERTRRLRQLVRELGGRTQVPRWEHRQGLASCVPIGEDRLRRRTLFDTSTLARTYPASNSTLVLEGGVPWGVTAHTPVVFTPFHSTLKNPHMAFYATSGAGKGYAAKVLQARLSQGQSVRVFGVDQDEDEEYTRLAEYLGGQVVRFGARHVDLGQVQLGGPCTIFNLAELPERQRGARFSEIKQLVWSWVQRHGGPATFVVDEAVTLLRDEDAANEMEDLVRRGRHIQLGGVFITQRVADFLQHHLRASDPVDRRLTVVRATAPYGARARCGRPESQPGGKGVPAGRRHRRGIAGRHGPTGGDEPVGTYVAQGIRHGKHGPSTTRNGHGGD